MTICKSYGYPDLFITFTCNPNWPEIARMMEAKGMKSEDRPDATTRVFKIKLDTLIKEFREKRTFGRVEARKLLTRDVHIIFYIQLITKLVCIINISY